MNSKTILTILISAIGYCSIASAQYHQWPNPDTRVKKKVSIVPHYYKPSMAAFEGQQVRFQALAHWDDGTITDVTGETMFFSYMSALTRPNGNSGSTPMNGFSGGHLFNIGSISYDASPIIYGIWDGYFGSTTYKTVRFLDAGNSTTRQAGLESIPYPSSVVYDGQPPNTTRTIANFNYHYARDIMSNGQKPFRPQSTISWSSPSGFVFGEPSWFSPSSHSYWYHKFTLGNVPTNKIRHSAIRAEYGNFRSQTITIARDKATYKDGYIYPATLTGVPSNRVLVRNQSYSVGVNHGWVWNSTYTGSSTPPYLSKRYLSSDPSIIEITGSPSQPYMKGKQAGSATITVQWIGPNGFRSYSSWLVSVQ